METSTGDSQVRLFLSSSLSLFLSLLSTFLSSLLWSEQPFQSIFCILDFFWDQVSELRLLPERYSLSAPSWLLVVVDESRTLLCNHSKHSCTCLCSPRLCMCWTSLFSTKISTFVHCPCIIVAWQNLNVLIVTWLSWADQENLITWGCALQAELTDVKHKVKEIGFYSLDLTYYPLWPLDRNIKNIYTGISVFVQ